MVMLAFLSGSQIPSCDIAAILRKRYHMPHFSTPFAFVYTLLWSLCCLCAQVEHSRINAQGALT